MNTRLRFRLIILLLCVSLLAVTVPAQAQIGPTGGQVTGVVVAIVAVGAAIGVGAYFLIRKAPSITGCADASPNGLSLQNEGDHQTYMLIGDVANIKADTRVRVSGKRKKKDASGKRDFLVEKLAKDYGSCKVLPTTP